MLNPSQARRAYQVICKFLGVKHSYHNKNTRSHSYKWTLSELSSIKESKLKRLLSEAKVDMEFIDINAGMLTYENRPYVAIRNVMPQFIAPKIFPTKSKSGKQKVLKLHDEQIEVILQCLRLGKISPHIAKRNRNKKFLQLQKT